MNHRYSIALDYMKMIYEKLKKQEFNSELDTYIQEYFKVLEECVSKSNKLDNFNKWLNSEWEKNKKFPHYANILAIVRNKLEGEI